MRQRGEEDLSAYPYTNGTTIDSLSYAYEPFSNRLSSVTDGIDTNYNIGDFRDGHPDGADYAYDPNGNLTQDLNKEITGVTYTHFNKPQTIHFSNGNTIRYSYDAAGGKVQELITEGTTTNKTDYLGNFIYRNDSLQYAMTAQSRTVWQSDGTTMEDFFVKDHLGNVRAVVNVYEYPILVYLGTYELASANLENLFFEHHGEIRDDKPGSPDSTDTEAGRLNGADPDRRIGTALLLQVMSGDKVEMNVNSYVTPPKSRTI